jgi:ribosome-binding protein aMBF1 (putative translation factor)
MNFDNFDGETELLATPEDEAPPANIPATAIAAKVRAAKKDKKGKKAAKKASPKDAWGRAVKRPAKKKTAKSPAKKKAVKAKSSAAKGTLTKVGGVAVRPNAVGRTGRKGWPEAKRVRKGDSAFGRKVAKTRKAKGWPQWQLAEKVGCTQPAVCNIEKATAPVSEKLQAKICKVLGL